MFKLKPYAAAAMIVALLAGPGLASQVQLDVSMANRMLLAGKKQTTFVKVGLRGFKIKNAKHRAPVNVAIVLDKSGSMSGQKIAEAKAAAIAAVERLGRQDIVSVVAYDSTVRVVVPATKLSDKQSVINKIRQLDAGGSTALFAGVSKGAEEARKFIDKRRVNRIILLSDGLANVGPKSPSELGRLGATLMKEGISVSTMGLGLDYNEDLMTKLAQQSGGNHAFIEGAEDLVRIFNYEFNSVLSVVAQEVAINIRAAEGIRPVRVLNQDAEINGQQVIAKMNQLYSDQEKYVLLEVEVPPNKNNKTIEVAEVRVSYSNMETETTDRLSSVVSVKFTNSAADVEKNLNTEVSTACVLQISNLQNELATSLRDKGDIDGARRLLIANGKYLEDNGKKLNSAFLRKRGFDNRYQSGKLSDKDWAQSRKAMREQQFFDASQQIYSGAKPKPQK
ncbi:MAG: VWA domain-containing protein [Pirellulaceae bacterium]|jgi:Ca-activated chloride channel family protein|nr:VWA domain-containing protein [Pirellulaceae bacterium]